MRRVRESDFGVFWAAYNDGAFADVLMPELEPMSFKQGMQEFLAAVDLVWVVERAARPIALFGGLMMARDLGIEIQVDWMPWTSAREKVEAAATFLREVSREVKIFIFAAPADEKFYARLCRYRMLRNGCEILNYFSGGQHARLWYTPGPR